MLNGITAEERGFPAHAAIPAACYTSSETNMPAVAAAATHFPAV